LPLFISGIVGGFLAQFNNFLTAIYCTDQAIGNYSVALNFTTLISFFSLPIASVLLPAFSKLDAEKDKEALATVFRLSVRYGTLLVAPAATAMMILSPMAVATLFGTKYSDAPLYLTFLSLGALYTALGNLSIGSFINSRGRTSLSMRLALVNSAIGFPLSLVLISRFQILGLIATNLITGIPGLLLGIWLIKRHWGVTIDYYASAKTLAASALAALATYVAVRTVDLPDWLSLLMGALLFMAIYFLAAPLVGAIDGEDIKTMKEMIEELGPLSGLLHKPIDLMGRLTRSKG
jgi:O-antigen/teichoic acid export membrane protein